MKDSSRKLLHAIAVARMPVILVGLIIAATILTGGFNGRFFSSANLVNVLRQVSFEAIIAFGMTLVIITGGIDLSVGSLVALTGVASAIIMRETGDWPAWVSIAAGGGVGITLGALVGTTTGTIVAWGSIPPFIATLAAMLAARGFAFIICDGKPVYEVPEALSYLGRGFVMEGLLGRMLPIPVLVMLLAFGAFSFLLGRTVFGRQVIAVGSNESAARLAGIPVRRTKMLVYVVIGAVSGIAGLLLTAKLGTGDPKIGEMWELNVIAAVVVGGTSLFGGRGTMLGTLIGALIIGVLNNTLNLLHVDSFWQKVVLGGVILTAALIDSALRRLER